MLHGAAIPERSRLQGCALDRTRGRVRARRPSRFMTEREPGNLLEKANGLTGRITHRKRNSSYRTSPLQWTH